MLFSRLALVMALCSPLFGGYARRSTITFPAAASGTLTNVTLVTVTVAMNDLRTVPNGGVIQNATCTHVIANIPCDLIVTNDAMCTSVTGGYKWGFETYDGSAGTARFWVLISSLGASSVIPYVCFGNLAVVSYLGGSAGDEFPSSAGNIGAWHLPDGTTLNNQGFAATPCDGVPTNVTATTGKIDGAGSFTTATSRDMLGGTACGGNGTVAGILDVFTFTYEEWVNSAASSGDIYNGGANGLPQFRLLSSSGNKLSLDNAGTGSIGVSTGTITTGAFHHVVVTFDGSAGPAGTGTWTFYIDGSAAGTGTATIPANWIATTSRFITHTWRLGQLNTTPNMTIDEARVYNLVLPANWIATEYANQNSPPAMSAPISLGNCTRTLLGVGC